MFDKNYFIKVKACAIVDMVTRFFALKKVFSKLTQSLLYSHIYIFYCFKIKVKLCLLFLRRYTRAR